MGKAILGLHGKRDGTIRVNEEDLVVVGVETDSAPGDIICDDEVTALTLELPPCVCLDFFGLGGKSHHNTLVAEFAPGRPENVGIADEFERKAVTGFLDLVFCEGSGAIVSDRSREDCRVLPG